MSRHRHLCRAGGALIISALARLGSFSVQAGFIALGLLSTGVVHASEGTTTTNAVGNFADAYAATAENPSNDIVAAGVDKLRKPSAANTGPTILRVGAIFSTAQSSSQSFLRFYNTGASAGTATVTLYDADSGTSIGQWTSPSIPSGAATQYPISTVEAGVGHSFNKPNYYTIGIQSDITGYFQHVLWRAADGTLTNLSTCSNGITANVDKLNGVHSTLLGSLYPSSIVVNNNGASAANVTLGVYDARDGTRLGGYVTSSIAAGGQTTVSVTDLQSSTGITPSAGMYHYVIKAEGAFTGFLQHLVNNVQVGVVTDMTTVCALNLTPPATTSSSTVRVGAVFSSSQSASQSFLRFVNAGPTAGTATVSLRDYQSGQTLGQWTSPSIPAGAATQYPITTVEAALPQGSTKPSYYSLAIQSTMSGYFQHVLWRSSDGTLTNLSTCSSGVTANAKLLNGVHTSLLGTAYPSSIIVNNTGSTAANVTLGIYDARNGTKLGTYGWSGIPANGQTIISMAAMEFIIGKPTSGMYHYVVRIEGNFTGYLQNLVNNVQAGVVTDMTTVCALPLPPLAIGPVSSSTPTALSPLHIKTTGLDTTKPYTVTLTDATGASTSLTPIRTDTDGTVTVAMPIYISPTTGQTAARSATVKISQGTQSTSAVSLNIQDIPQLSAYGTTLGQISRAFYNYQAVALGKTINALQAMQHAPGTQPNTSATQADLFQQLNNVIKARNDIDRLMTNNSVKISTGNLSDGTPIFYDKTSLELQDRVLAVYLTALAPSIQTALAPGGLASAPEGTERPQAIPDISTLLKGGFGLVATYDAVNIGIRTTVEQNKDTADTLIAIGSGVAAGVGLVATIAGAPEIAAAAAIAGAVCSAAAATTDVMHIASDYTELLKKENSGASAAEIAEVKARLKSDAINLPLDVAGAALGVLGIPSKGAIKLGEDVVKSLEALDTAHGVAIGGAAFVVGRVQAYLQNKEIDEQNAIKQAADNMPDHISSSSQGFGSVDGQVIIANSQGPILSGLDLVYLSDSKGDQFAAMADSNGKYDIQVPLGNLGINYQTLTLGVSDPITGDVLSSQTVDLRGLSSTTPYVPPVLSGVCYDDDANDPDSDDPDCD